MTGLFRFLASSAGRITRIVAGVILIAVGLVTVQGTGGAILAIVGLVPLAAGVFDFCVFAPLAGFPFNGNALRKAVK